MEALDRQLLNVLQRSVPLVPRPFAALGSPLGIDEEEALSRTRRLKDRGIIRQIGPIFSSSRLGYQSTLVAFQVEPGRLDDVAAVVSAHPGVSHNYSRNHNYNLWFTLTIPSRDSIGETIFRLAAAGQVTEYLNLPSLMRFKLGVHFDMSNRAGDSMTPERDSDRPQPPVNKAKEQVRPMTTFERGLVRQLQGDMNLVAHPFRYPAAALGITEQQLLEAARDLNKRGIMRRFSAVLKHRRAGFRANGMGCWVIPEERVVEAGKTAAGFAAVSHCYQRPAFPPQWPYNLFTMVHGHTREEVQGIVARIHKKIGPVQYTILYSQKEYKKQRVRYFVDD